MIVYAWNLSFADIIGNKEAFCEQGLNPLNKNLLLLGELMQTMTESDKKEIESLGILGAEKLRLVETSCGRTPDQHTVSRSPTNEETLNLSCGYAAEMVDKIVGHVDLEKAWARNLVKSKLGAMSKIY